MTPRRSLSEILNDNDRTKLRQAWNNTQAAADLKPLPTAEYVAHVLSGELDTARTGTLCYKLTFQVIEGEHTGRRFWHDIWLTAGALPMAKRDLAKLGVADLDQLERPLPQGIRVKAKVVLRRDDDGIEHNRVKSFDVIGIDTPKPDAFAPEDGNDTQTTPAESAPAAGGNGQHRDLFPKPAERTGLPDVG
jgi:hypothetical protein